MWQGPVASTVHCRLGRARKTGEEEGVQEPEFVWGRQGWAEADVEEVELTGFGDGKDVRVGHGKSLGPKPRKAASEVEKRPQHPAGLD